MAQNISGGEPKDSVTLLFPGNKAGWQEDKTEQNISRSILSCLWILNKEYTLPFLKNQKLKVKLIVETS